MGSDSNQGEATLVRAVRALDQGDTETVPDKLERLWNLLPSNRGGAFHAAEEMLVRWLLKNMTGNTTNGERLRRYPPTWNVLGAVFTCVPLFSLAKSLADRRFVSILQQTFKEVSAPQEEPAQANGVDSDVEMADAFAEESAPNPRKRKRTAPSSFEISYQRQAEGCLHTAEAVFEAIRILLRRCEAKSLEGSPNHRMGAEHIKSLFSTSASEAAATLVPLLTACNLAVDQRDLRSFEEQSTWISTINALWELRLQGPDDTASVAAHLAVPGMALFGKLTGISRKSACNVDSAVREQWTRDLGRFLARNLVFPCRTALLNAKDQVNIVQVVEIASSSAAQIYPVLFNLVTRSYGDKAAKKEYEVWTQSVFDIILEALRSNDRDPSLAAIEGVMEIAAERDLALPASSLRAVCKEFALGPGKERWNLLLPIVKLNSDVFLLSDEGEGLLQQALQKTQNPQLLDSADLDKASQFIVRLAQGYARARDLATFIKIWTKYLIAAGPEAPAEALWSQPELSQTVASHVEQFLNVNQLLEILDTLASGEDAAGASARIQIIDALSAGIKNEEFVDVANMKAFETAYSHQVSRKELSDKLAAGRWALAAKCLPKGTLEEVGRIWSRIKDDASHVLRKSSIRKQETFTAFQCCVAVWVANYPNGQAEEEVGSMVCAFVDRLIESTSKPDGKKSSKEGLTAVDYVRWMVSKSARATTLINLRKDFFPLLLSLSPAEEPDQGESFLRNENNLYNHELMVKLLDSYIDLLRTSGGEMIDRPVMQVIQCFNDAPRELLSRTQREALMSNLTSRLSPHSNAIKSADLADWVRLVSLMSKLMMEMPTVYEGMSFSHVEMIGNVIQKIQTKGKRLEYRDEWLALKLVGELAKLSVGQMSSATLGQRGKTYFTKAINYLQRGGNELALRLKLLRAFLLTTNASLASRQLESWDSDVASLRRVIVSLAQTALTNMGHDRGLLAATAALEALDLLDADLIKEAVGRHLPPLVEASKTLDGSFETFSWEVRMFLAKHYPESLGFPFTMAFPKTATSGDMPTNKIDKSALLRYVDAVVRDADDEAKLGYLEELIRNGGATTQDPVAELMVIYRLAQHIKGTKDATITPTFDLSQAHSALCTRLLHASTVPEFALTAKSIHLLLDQRSWCLSQWNIEVTLSTVSTVASRPCSTLAASPKVYHGICALVEIIIKRHRIRLDGHFHILITALHSVLRLLISQKSVATSAHAQSFARLLTLICEPTDASVSRSSGAGGLDSERDRAKRYAGQYMYLVLMQYIKLQLELPVLPAVREVLDSAMYSVSDITTQDGMKLMNDAMDPSGRVIFRELYKRYQKFGKWSGV
ncbi:nucleolar pre-ribosomal-associated protein 2 [Podospora aff. communis PSN243]|uniref:Nucleolar pre-ribosomal-associated protein 2 n=1 Tax=Podospora aff. communis PSN243 TaxID=3040156 RepID=A0AAV9G5W8_9PEZI|nr:nucleolar pre-ribosomal-associated protein 2 [Podospora aff. communis PSN243]